MSIKINGIEPKRILVEQYGKTTELTRLNVCQGEDYRCGWIKPYTLYISKGSHSAVTVGYKGSEYSSVLQQLSSGDTITHGCYLDITVTGRQGYTVTWKINGVTQSAANAVIKVTGDVSISVTEIATVVSLTYPNISGSFTYDSYANSYYLSCNIQNNNSCAVNASIVVYSNGDSLDGTWSVSIPANSSRTYNHGEMYSIGAKVQFVRQNILRHTPNHLQLRSRILPCLLCC